MSEDLKNNIRLSKAAKEFNIGMSTIIEFLGKKGHKIDSSPNTKLNGEMYALLVKEYQGEKEVKKNADQLGDFSYKGKSITVESTIKKEDNDFEEEELSIRMNGSIADEKAHTKSPPCPRDTAGFCYAFIPFLRNRLWLLPHRERSAPAGLPCCQSGSLPAGNA